MSNHVEFVDKRCQWCLGKTTEGSYLTHRVDGAYTIKLDKQTHYWTGSCESKQDKFYFPSVTARDPESSKYVKQTTSIIKAVIFFSWD